MIKNEYEKQVKTCDYCGSCDTRLSIVQIEILFGFMPITHILCEHCIEDLEHDNRVFRILRRL